MFKTYNGHCLEIVFLNPMRLSVLVTLSSSSQTCRDIQPFSNKFVADPEGIPKSRYPESSLDLPNISIDRILSNETLARITL